MIYILVTLLYMAAVAWSSYMLGRSTSRINLSKRIAARLSVLQKVSKAGNLNAEAIAKMQGRLEIVQFVMDCTTEDARKDPMYRMVERISAKRK